MSARILAYAAILLAFAPSASATAPEALLSDLSIEVRPDHPREFIFTDKGAAHICGEAVGPDSRSYHGFYVAMHELLDGWALVLEDGTELSGATADAARVRPDRLERDWRLPSGETVTAVVEIFDRADGFHIHYEGVPSGRFAFVPRLDMRFLWKVARPAYRIEWAGGVLRAAREDRLDRADGERHPPWLAVAVGGADDFASTGTYRPTVYPKSVARRAMERAEPYLPGEIRGRIPSLVPVGRVEVVVGTGDSSEAAAAAVADLRGRIGELDAARRARLADVADPRRLSTGVPRDDRALAWARVSLDNLVMEQRGPGIYAGFYWFTTYWGRDTFIVLPGALAAGLDFDVAREILRSFAAYQDRDPHSPRFGRVPNFVTVDQVQYASIDGTWWFVRALDEYWRRSGDHDFAREMMPVVFRACEGALVHAVDAEGLLAHGNGETWMDGGGEAHPYSPRGDRAVEAQALFHRGLGVAARLAERFDGRAAGLTGADLATRYDRAAQRLWDAVQRLFVVDGRIVDHLNPDGTPDRQHRPNGLLALLVAPDLFNSDQRRLIVDENRAHTVTPWGVRSLDAADPDYHPRHLWLERYYYDEAYHNGDVWLWLSGPWVSALPDPREGFGQTRMLMDEILDEGAVGTLQEIRDGDRAASNDEFGGATSQAWSLSELLRTVVDDYLGVRVDLSGERPVVEISPALPDAWPDLAGEVRVGGDVLQVEVVRGDDGRTRVTHAFATDASEVLRRAVRVVD